MGLGAASTGTGSGRTPGVTLVVLPGMGSRTSALASTYTMKADSDAIAGAYSLVEEEFSGDTTPLHVHVGAEEAFYVLSGRVAAWASESETGLEAGTFLLVPRGTPHALRRVDPAPVRMLTLISPPGLQRFFDEVEARGEDELLDEPERLIELAAGYGTLILGDYPGA